MKITQQYGIGDEVSFTLTEGELEGTVTCGKKTVVVLVSDLYSFAHALLGSKINNMVPPTRPASSVVARAVATPLDDRKASGSAPYKAITMDEMRKMEKPLSGPSNVFGGIGPMAPAGGDGVRFGGM